MKFRNVEVKVRVHDHAGIPGRLTALGATGPVRMLQEDTYYRCSSGRLKLRRSGSEAELVYYGREDVAGPKLSNYWRTAITDPGQLHKILAQTNGLLGVVRKLRQLYMIGETRIHLDEVEHLGTFLEIEVVLEKSGNEEDGCRKVRELLSALDIDVSECISVSYLDLLCTDCRSITRG